MSKARLLSILDEDPDLVSFNENEDHELSVTHKEDLDYLEEVRARQITVNRRVQVCRSPTVPMKYNKFEISVMLDSGGETNMILEATALEIGAEIRPTTQSALQADGKSRMSVKGETTLTLCFGNMFFKFIGLVVEHLDVPILAGMPFLKNNDIRLHPFKSSIIFGDGKCN